MKKHVGIFSAIALIASVVLATEAKATIPIGAQSRSLPEGSTMYAISCDTRVPDSQLARVNTATAEFTNIGTGSTDPYATNYDHANRGCAGAATYVPSAGLAYYFNWRSDALHVSSSRLFSMDVATGVSTYIGELTPGANVYGADANGHLREAWAMTSDADGVLHLIWSDTYDSHFWVGTVNAATGHIDNPVALDDNLNADFNVAGAYTFSYNPVDGQYYGLGYYGTSPHLWRINVSTGVGTDLGGSGQSTPHPCAMVFDTNGVLWGSDLKIQSATVAGWTDPTDFQRTTTNSAWYSESLFIVPAGGFVRHATMVPDPVQKSSITSSSVDTTTVGTQVTATISGNFVENVSAIQVNGVNLPSTSWKQTATAVTLTFTPEYVGKYAVQIFDGSAPALQEQHFTFTVNKVPTPATLTLKKPRNIYIHCAKEGKGTRIVYGVSPTCPVGYTQTDN